MFPHLQILRSSDMDDRISRSFTEAFSSLESRGIRVLWKWEAEDMEGKPANLRLMTWLPQQDVLGTDRLGKYISQRIRIRDQLSTGEISLIRVLTQFTTGK